MDETQEGTGGSALKAMISFFTIWQQDITKEDMDAMEKDFHLAPIVGLFFGLILVVLMTVLTILNVKYGFGSGMIYAAMCLAAVWIGSKFIHFDGLTDFGDGMIVSGTQEDHVRALKDTLVGAGGIGVAVAVVLLSFSMYSFASFRLLIFAPLAEILVKNAMVVAAAYGKPGNGMAGKQVAMTTTDSMLKSTAISAILGIVMSVGLVAFFGMLYDSLDVGLETGLVAVIVAFIVGLIISIVAGFLMARKANNTFGMVNGDILGATNEISRPLIMMIMMIVFMAW